MEGLIETLLTLLPLAIILALRLASSKIEQAKKQQNQAELTEAVTARLGGKKEGHPLRNVSQKQVYKPAFLYEEPAIAPIARWEDAPASNKKTVQSLLAVSDSGPSPIDSVEYSSASGGAVRSRSAGALSAHAIESQKKEKPGFSDGPVVRNSTFAAVDRIEQLPRIQQAVIYAELLG
ncbi:MAG: hypothetical protein SNJ56_00560, partial [Termitinemataceae bacterium]